MSIQIKIFGQLAEITGNNELHLQNVSDTDSLRKKLVSDYSKLQHCSFVIAVDKKIVTENLPLNAGDVVALLPPFAGG